MQSDRKSLFRAVVRQVHPDLFTALPYERSKNAESLKVRVLPVTVIAAWCTKAINTLSKHRDRKFPIKSPNNTPLQQTQVLNVYADQVSHGTTPSPVRLEFYTKRSDGTCQLIVSDLLSNGSLAPLFLAFGLITAEEAFDEEAAVAGKSDERDLFEWLSGIAAEAALAADQHDAMKRELRLAKADLEDRYGFSSVDIGGEFAVDVESQRRQLSALETLRDVLNTLQSDPNIQKTIEGAFTGLPVRLYHPDMAPLTTVGYQDAEGTFNVRSERMRSHVSENGTLHIVADPEQLPSALQGLPLDQGRVLAQVNSYWAQRSRDLAGVLQSLLGVENVWYDTRIDHAAQKFTLWAGTVLDMRAEIEEALMGRKFAFSVLVHGDDMCPLLDFIDSSSVLQLRTGCPPKHLLAFMISEAGRMANDTANLVADTRAEETAALEAVKVALGAKHVVRLCSSYDQVRVLEAASRLVKAAPSIRAAMDLSGVSLAIDDCYDVWDSGFVSIPYDFNLADIEPKLKALLSAPVGAPAAAASGAGMNGNQALGYSRAVPNALIPRHMPGNNRTKKAILSRPGPMRRLLPTRLVQQFVRCV